MFIVLLSRTTTESTTDYLTTESKKRALKDLGRYVTLGESHTKFREECVNFSYKLF